MRRGLSCVAAVVVVAACGEAVRDQARDSGDEDSAMAKGVQPPAVPDAPTFHRDVLPIVYDQCAACHREGEAGPFPLVTYDDAAKHARQMVEVTHSGYMPPWLPTRAAGELMGERGLDERQRQVLARWAEQGAPEGDAADAPTPPTFVDGWQLGEPDLVIELAPGYGLAADGEDVYRNFVLPIPVDQPRFVKAVEFRTESPKVVHHAVMRVDSSGSSRRLDEKTEGQGFAGMVMGEARMPDGQFLGWTPGRVPWEGDDDLAWGLQPGTDMVLQMHMRPTGKPETVRAKVGFFFAKRPPRSRSLAILLSSKKIDIPPGEGEYRVGDSYVLPVDVDLLSVYPHAHYLGKQLRGFAKTPDGKERELIHIDRWDFDWQDQFRFVKPISLPAGTELRMDYTYDNSADNPFNPRSPPVSVQYGPESTDEMAELILEVRPKDRAGLVALDRDFERKWLGQEIAWLREVLAEQPSDANARATLGAYLKRGGDFEAAIPEFERAAMDDPTVPGVHASLGAALAAAGRYDEAIAAYKRARERGPGDVVVHNNLGTALMKAGKLDAARRSFERAIEIEPNYANAYNNLGILARDRGRFADAAAHFQTAIEARPNQSIFVRNLADALAAQGHYARAVSGYERTLSMNGNDVLAAEHLAWLLATCPDETVRDGARATMIARQAVQMTQARSPSVMDTMGAALAASGDFAAAHSAAQRAIELADAAKDPQMRAAFAEHQASYANERAWVGPPR